MRAPALFGRTVERAVDVDEGRERVRAVPTACEAMSTRNPRSSVRPAVVILSAVEGPRGEGLSGVPLTPPHPESIATAANVLSTARRDPEMLIPAS